MPGYRGLHRADEGRTTDAVSNNELFNLDMQLMKTANSTALVWNDVEKVPFSAGADSVMALAQNHIHFFDVPNVPAGSASIFVIHCGYSL